MNIKVEFVVNGEMRRLETEGQRTLLEVLRENLHLTGTKYGCGEGQCRSCTVLLDGVPVPSCLTPVESVAGRKVQTIEGLAEGDALHSVQQAFIEEGAMQCGYCVPGMILATVALLKEHPQPDRESIVQSINGNLCRCCNYPNILKAVERAAQRG